MRRLLQIFASVVAVAVVATGAYLVLRQEKGPSGASVPPAEAVLPPLSRTELTVTCTPEIVGDRGDIFSTAMFMPQWVGTEHDDVVWEKGYLDETDEVLRDLIRTVGPRVYLRFGHQPTDGYIDSRGALRTGYRWREALDGEEMSVDEYVAYAKRVGAQTQMVVNFGTAEASDAADLVAYANGTDFSDPMVALRKQRGHDRPFGIGVWEIGNEQYGHWEAGFDRYPDGSVGSRDPDAFIRRTNKFATEMRARSASPVRLIAPLTNWELNSYSDEALMRIVRETAPNLDGYAIHFYPLPDDGNSPDRWMGMAHRLKQKLARLKEMISEATPKQMELTITEWAGSAYPTHMGRNWLTGILLVDSFLSMAESGVSIANYFASAAPRGTPGGYSYWLDGDPTRPAPTLIATKETALHLGREMLETRTTGVPLAESATDVRGPFNFPVVGAKCSRRGGDRTLVAVNRSSRPRLANFDMQFPIAGDVRLTQLLGPTQAESVDIIRRNYRPVGKFSFELPPFSVAFFAFPSGEVAGSA